MTRLCERPGCSEPGATAYGMIPEELVFWLAPIDDIAADNERVICLRHADAMVVPRGWTLDDRRDRDLHLFNTHRFGGGDAPERATRTRSRGGTGTIEVEQLQIDGTGEIERPPLPEPDDEASTDAEGTVLEPVAVDDEPWRPSFDDSDDLNGLLHVNSPLLSRAFRGIQRRRR